MFYVPNYVNHILTWHAWIQKLMCLHALLFFVISWVNDLLQTNTTLLNHMKSHAHI